MAFNSIDLAFGPLWASIKQEVTNLYRSDQAQSQYIREKLLWLSQNIQAEWLLASYTQDDQKDFYNDWAPMSCSIVTERPYQEALFETTSPRTTFHTSQVDGMSPTFASSLMMSECVDPALTTTITGTEPIVHVNIEALPGYRENDEAGEAELQIEHQMHAQNGVHNVHCLMTGVNHGSNQGCSCVGCASASHLPSESEFITSLLKANIEAPGNVSSSCHSDSSRRIPCAAFASSEAFANTLSGQACSMENEIVIDIRDAAITTENADRSILSRDCAASAAESLEQHEGPQLFDESHRQADGGTADGASNTRRSLRRHELSKSSLAPPNVMEKRNSRDHGKSHHAQEPCEDRQRTLFQELGDVNQDIVQPQDMCQRLMRECPHVTEDTVLVLVRLFYAIASPQALSQLRDACILVRTQSEVIVPQNTNTAAQTIRAINALDSAATVHSLLRRYHLVRLLAHRAEKEKSYEIEQQSRRRAKKSERRKTHGLCRYESSSSLAITDLMNEAYPYLIRPLRMRDALKTEYGRRYGSLKHMLVAGRNWHALQQAFSSGVLALIPTGRDFGIHNSEIERLPAQEFNAFLTILVDLRGDFIKKVSAAVSQGIPDIMSKQDLRSTYRFEKADADVLDSYALDAPTLIELCQVDRA